MEVSGLSFCSVAKHNIWIFLCFLADHGLGYTSGSLVHHKFIQHSDIGQIEQSLHNGNWSCARLRSQWCLQLPQLIQFSLEFLQSGHVLVLYDSKTAGESSSQPNSRMPPFRTKALQTWIHALVRARSKADGDDDNTADFETIPDGHLVHACNFSSHLPIPTFSDTDDSGPPAQTIVPLWNPAPPKNKSLMEEFQFEPWFLALKSRWERKATIRPDLQRCLGGIERNQGRANSWDFLDMLMSRR